MVGRSPGPPSPAAPVGSYDCERMSTAVEDDTASVPPENKRDGVEISSQFIVRKK